MKLPGAGEGWLLTALATLGVVGTATVAYLTYRHTHDEQRQSIRVETSQRQGNRDSDTVGEIQPDDEETAESKALDEAVIAEQNIMISRAGSTLLVVFAILLFLAIVSVAGILTIINDDDFSQLTDYPMFSPLMWISAGVLVVSGSQALDTNVGQVIDERKKLPEIVQDGSITCEDESSNNESDDLEEKPSPGSKK